MGNKARMTQEEVELRMYRGGIDRAEAMMSTAEAKGRAITNPYARALIDDYVMPLAKAIQVELDSKRAGIRHAHAKLLAPLDPEAVASLAIRSCINDIFKDPGNAHLRSIAHTIGRSIHNELVLSRIEETAPELFYTLSRDFNRRLSKDERHRMTVFKMQAKDAGIDLPDWSLGARDQVGIYLMGMIEALGMIEIDPSTMSKGKVADRIVMLHPDLMERIGGIKAYAAMTMPMFGPCVEPPIDWTAPVGGGFHTHHMRRLHGTLVRHRLARSPLYTEANMPTVLQAVNNLQRTAWQVNAELLDIVMEVGKHFSVGEIQSLADDPKPEQLPWADSDRDTWTEEQKAAFKEWKHTRTAWFTRRKVAKINFTRFYSATRNAELFRDYPAIYFVYFADSRGRLYPMTYGMNPQGSDLQKGLLRFAEGLPLRDDLSRRWFCIQGANKWGFDKATLEERQQWVMERADLFVSFAENPLDNVGWKDADNPIQFLAWCLEFAKWRRDPDTFVSHLPISMDGSCNGLQHLSALLRDEVGGYATNLTNSAVMQDIYRQVAVATEARLKAQSYDDPIKESFRLRWLQHGINRTVVKRSVMTTPYGVTRRSAAEYVVSDYLKEGRCSLFERHEWMRAAAVLMDSLWPAIGDVVVRGRKAMDWLRATCRAVLKDHKDGDDCVISWTGPSGFPACQAYYKAKVHRINTKLHGEMKIRVMAEVDEIDDMKHCKGMAPNFVHSLDAAHLHLTAAACTGSISSLAMVHDDYGTHAANSQLLYEKIRYEFVRMYEENDPIEDLRKKYPQAPKPPERGTLDIKLVKKSPFFYS